MSARPLVLTLLTAALALPTLAAAAPVGTTQLVDRPSGLGALPFDGAGNAQIGAHAVSADGRFVVFTSQSDSLVAGDEDSAQGIYRLDRVGGRVEQVDHGGPWDLATEPSISADGRRVAFLSVSLGAANGTGQGGSSSGTWPRSPSRPAGGPTGRCRSDDLRGRAARRVRHER